MNEQFKKWLPYLALAFYATAVFLIADGYFWMGIVLFGAGSCFSSIAEISKKKSNVTDPKNNEIE